LNTIYGCLFWGFFVHKDGSVTSDDPEFVSDPVAYGSLWSDSIANWNAQANGEKPPKNSPGQVKLPPFTVGDPKKKRG
jgi:hypothetical protein